MIVLKKTSILITVAVLLVVAAVIYFNFSPTSSAWFPKCPFYVMTGYQCPGCGSQRALHFLLHLQFKKAFLTNPFFIVALPYLIVIIYLQYFGGKFKFPKLRNFLMGRNACIVILILIILFWIGRNIFRLT